MSQDRSGPEPAPEKEGGAEGATPRPPAPPSSIAAPVCEVCGTVMYDRHCKIACPNCGYLRDCSDP